MMVGCPIPLRYEAQLMDQTMFDLRRSKGHALVLGSTRLYDRAEMIVLGAR